MNKLSQICRCLCLAVTLLTTSIPCLGKQPLEASPPGAEPPAIILHLHDTPSDGPGNAPPRTPHRPRPIGLTGLGLMASLLGAWWQIRRTVHKNRRRRLNDWRSSPRRGGGSDPSPSEASGKTPARQRLRRFDYDRFYLHMLRDL